MLRFVAYVWLGLVVGVSFIATPVKFRAESLTLPVALDVGRTTFHLFGKVEWALTVILAVAAYLVRDQLSLADWALVGLVVMIIVLQGGWLIPRLDVRVAAVIADQPLPPSHLHTVYAGAEAVKAIALLLLGLWSARNL